MDPTPIPDTDPPLSLTDPDVARAAGIVGEIRCTFAPDATLTWVSDSVEPTLGYTPDRYLTMTVHELVHPDDVEFARQTWRHLIAVPGAEARYTLRMRAADGSWRDIDVLAQNRTGEPELDCIVASMRDVSDRVRADQELRASEERLRLLLDHSRDALALVDATSAVRWISPVVTQLLGYAPDALSGRSIFELVHHDDLAASLATAAEALGSGVQAAPQTLRVRNAGDEWQPVEVAAGLLDRGGESWLVLNLRDARWQVEAAQRLEASEQRLRAIIEHAPATAEIIDRDGTIVWISDNVTEVLGWAPDEMVGRGGADFVHPDEVSDLAALFLQVAAEPGSSGTIEMRARHRDGSWRWIANTFTNRLDDPSVDGMVANFRDITDDRTAEQALRDSERLFRSLARSSPVGIYQQDADGSCTYVNERWQLITGYTEAEALGDGWKRIIHPDDRQRISLDRAPDEPWRPPREAEVRIVRANGAVRWVSIRTAAHLGEDGAIAGLVGTMEDITDRVDAQRDAQRLLDIFEATTDLVGIGEPDGRVVYLNATATEFFGRDEDAESVLFLELVPEHERRRLGDEVLPALADIGMWSGELTVVRHDGRHVPVLAQLLVHLDGEGTVEFFSGVLHDISERKAFETALAHQATHDPLTGLPNRTLLLTRLEHALARARRQRSRTAVLFCDLDHFKIVNDSLGHDVGDRLLVEITERLRHALRPGDTIARFGGDEFVVLCEDLHGRADAVAIAERVIEALSGAFAIDDAEIHVGASLGIAFPDDPDAHPGTLIRDADAAMYRAKEKGRGRWEIFDNAMRASAVDRLDIENFLRRALDRRELRVHYQPVVDLVTGAISGVEALLRWEHPERGLLQPSEFIGVAEETGLIVGIGRWVIEQACVQARRWEAALPGQRPLQVSVNLSGRQLGHPSLVDDVRAILEATGMPPARLELEITESVLMDDVEASEETLHRLRGLGVRIAVDDFGTGYSSLSYLRRFPVDRLKVDRSFVRGLGEDPSDSAIVTAIVTLAHTLGLDALAEGVETTVQLEELRTLGCDHAQGFWFAKPLGSEDLADLLKRHPHGFGPAHGA
ncbi:MAG: PAS domain S-box protein [Acidimicrobiales bacterium]|nr:PAS domain S-box protein [Acidimicrobiales bacterium]